MKSPAWIAIVIAAPLAAQDTETVSLADAVRVALARHPDVAKTRAAAGALKGKVREVLRLTRSDPTCSFTTSL
jgi:hypothetical protein